MPEQFWVLPCLEMPFAYVVYRDNGKEVKVEVKNGKIIWVQEALTALEREWFDKNVLK